MADLIGLATARHGGKPALTHEVDGEWVEVSYERLDEMVRELALGLVDLGTRRGRPGFDPGRTRGPERTRCASGDVRRRRDCRARPIRRTRRRSAHYVLRHFRGSGGVRRGRRAAGAGPRRRGGPAGAGVRDRDRPGGRRRAHDRRLLRCASGGEVRSQAALVGARRRRQRLEAGCLFLYTSGTTGPPKACELTHGNYRAITSALETQDLGREDAACTCFCRWRTRSR